MQGLSQTLQSLGTVRLAAMGAVALGLILFFVFMSSRLGSPDMALLYGDLDTADSAQIVSKLESMGVPYELRAEGRQILVPSNEALRLRMSMAQDGLPAGGTIGYEIFDRSEALGTTNFVQNVNLLRALEGELSRTIRSISSVHDARVHLVMPKRELFSRRKQEPRASVFLNVRGNHRLSKAQVRAVQHIVSAAVPGLRPARISVVDQQGRLLARGNGDEDDSSQQSANHEDQRRAYEERLTRIIEELLERSVGIGKIRARVNAEIDFDRITTNTETYDPEGQVVRSTQTIEESARSAEAGGNASVTVGNNLPDANTSSETAAGTGNESERTEETVNYEISKTVRQHVREIGTPRRLTVAVLVDGTYSADDDGVQKYQPRDQQQLEKLASLVRSAIGFDAKRGDVVDIINMQFAALDDGSDQAEAPLFGLTKADYFRIAELMVLAIVGILIILLVVRPLVTRTLDALPSALGGDKEQALLADQSVDGNALAGPQGTGVSVAPLESEEDLIDVDQIEGQVRRSTLKKIAEIVDKHPEETVSILRQWLYQEA